MEQDELEYRKMQRQAQILCGLDGYIGCLKPKELKKRQGRYNKIMETYKKERRIIHETYTGTVANR